MVVLVFGDFSACVSFSEDVVGAVAVSPALPPVSSSHAPSPGPEKEPDDPENGEDPEEGEEESEWEESPSEWIVGHNGWSKQESDGCNCSNDREECNESPEEESSRMPPIIARFRLHLPQICRYR